MRLLFLHADHFSYHVTGDTSITKMLDPIPESMHSGSADEVLVCMVGVEKGDNAGMPEIIENAVDDLLSHCEKISTKRIFLYPYAHLSSSLEAPRAAAKVFDAIEKALKKQEGLEIFRAPFGTYKGFEIKVKGHPLSEMGRTITADQSKKEAESTALKGESELKSEWLVVTPDGQSHAIDDFNLKNHPALKKLLNYEISGSRVAEEPPPHIKIMQEHELVDYEPGSDQGNFRWYPKGYLMKKLLEEQANSMLQEYGVMQVETPIMYDLNHPSLAKYLDKFPARQYLVRSDTKDYFLRFAACFGQYLMKHDMQISYRNLPLRLYELTHFSFRREQSGEIAGLRRLRTFTMPDMHTLCTDISQAKQEMINQVDLSLKWIQDMGFEKGEIAMAVRAVKEFYDENHDYVKEIAARTGQPVLVELWDKRYFYFITKFEVNFVDSQDKASALSTVQIDVENPHTFGINYVNPDGDNAVPLMLHASISGSIDRNIYALLEKQAMRMNRGEKAGYPFWISPTQIRLIPLKEHHVEFCKDLAGKLKGRVDIDDRNETLGKRIRNAEKEWIPVVIVIGEREVNSDILPIRIRGERGESKMTLDQIISYYDQNMVGKIYRGSNLPQLLSLRPLFRG